MTSKTNRNYKDGIFRSLFNDKDTILELYNALTMSSYPEDTEIEIVTLDNIIFNGIKNDLAFIIDNRFVVLTEQQSTMSPNFPLRLFCYLAKVYEKVSKSGDIYSSKLIELPTPELYVFYNGPHDEPLEQVMKLSDAFKGKSDIIAVEAIVKIINVNYEKGAQLLEQCHTLNQYSLFVFRVRELYAQLGSIDDAIEECVREFIEKDILADFLMKHRGDIMSVLEVNLTMEEQINIRVRDIVDDMRDGIEQEVKAKVEREVKAKVEREVKAKVEREVKAKVEQEVKAKVELEVKAKVEREVIIGIAKKLKGQGLSAEVIADSTGLSQEEINNL